MINYWANHIQIFLKAPSRSGLSSKMVDSSLEMRSIPEEPSYVFTWIKFS